MQHEIGNMLKIPVCRKQRQSVFQGVRSYPVIWIRQLHAEGQQLRTKAGIDGRRIGVGMQNFKRIQKFSRLLECCRRDFGMSLSEEKFTDNMSADHRRIMAQDEVFSPPVATPQ